MSLDIEEKLKEINLERVVREIASQEYDKEKFSDKRSEGLADYTNLIKEKLSLIINNIDILGEFMYKCGSVGWDDHAFWDKEKNIYDVSSGTNLYIGKFRRNSFHVWIEEISTGIGKEYGIEFVFKDHPSSIKGIFMYTFNLPNAFNFFYEKNSSRVTRRNFRTIKAKTAEEFADKYANLGEEKLFCFRELPFVLSSVPKAVERMYKIKRGREENLFGRLTSGYKKLELLNPDNQ